MAKHDAQLSDFLEALNREWPPSPTPRVLDSRRDRAITRHRAAVAASTLLGFIGIATATVAIDRLATSLRADIAMRGANAMIGLLEMPAPLHGPDRSD